MADPIPFRAVDGLRLGAEHRALLRPGEMDEGNDGSLHALPRYFYEVPSWEAAKAMKLTKNFTLAELLTVDCHEAPLLLKYFPHYVPCAVLVFARYLQEFRVRVDAPVYVAANGGYRSPAHQLSHAGSMHCWGTAVNIFRIGDTWLDNSKAIERYARIAESLGPEVQCKPYGPAPGEATDHLHFDIGYVHLIPSSFSEVLPQER